jgi:hypothetical protein
MKKLSVLLIGVLCTALSCSTQDEFKVTTNEQLLHTSYAFRSLNVDESKLDFELAERTTTDKGFNILRVPFKNSKGKNIINLLNNDGYIIFSALQEFQSTLKQDDYVKAYQENRFEGTLTILSSSGDYIGLDFQQSKVKSMFVGAGNGGVDAAARTEACAGMTEKGGALDCASASLEAEGPFSKAMCYIEIIPCLGLKVLDCLWLGCPMTPISLTKYVIINGEQVPVEPIADILNPPLVTRPVTKIIVTFE